MVRASCLPSLTQYSSPYSRTCNTPILLVSSSSQICASQDLIWTPQSSLPASRSFTKCQKLLGFSCQEVTCLTAGNAQWSALSWAIGGAALSRIYWGGGIIVHPKLPTVNLTTCGDGFSVCGQCFHSLSWAYNPDSFPWWGPAPAWVHTQVPAISLSACG